MIFWICNNTRTDAKDKVYVSGTDVAFHIQINKYFKQQYMFRVSWTRQDKLRFRAEKFEKKYLHHLEEVCMCTLVPLPSQYNEGEGLDRTSRNVWTPTLCPLVSDRACLQRFPESVQSIPPQGSVHLVSLVSYYTSADLLGCSLHPTVSQ